APIHPQAADDIEIERHARIAVVREDWTNDADGTQPFRRDLHDGGRMRIAAGKVNARREFPRPDGTHRWPSALPRAGTAGRAPARVRTISPRPRCCRDSD